MFSGSVALLQRTVIGDNNNSFSQSYCAALPWHHASAVYYNDMAVVGYTLYAISVLTLCNVSQNTQQDIHACFFIWSPIREGAGYLLNLVVQHNIDADKS